MTKRIVQYADRAGFPLVDGTLQWLKFNDDDVLYDVIIPEDIRLDLYHHAIHADSHAKVHSVVIPEGETLIPHHFLSAGFNLEKVILPTTIKRIDEGAFYNCPNLKEIELPDGLERIGHHAFCCCKALTEIEIPDSVKEIDTCAFDEIPTLKKIILPVNLEHLGNNVFDKNLSEECLHFYENGYYIGNRETDYFVLFKAEKGIKELSVHLDCKFIYSNAFLLNDEIEKVKLPSGIKEIGHSAFCFCSRLKSVNMPRDLVYINERAFDSCKSITKVILCKRIRKIDNCAFNGCNGIKTIRYKGNSKDWKTVDKGYDWIPENTTIDLVCDDQTIRRDESLSRYMKKSYFG